MCRALKVLCVAPDAETLAAVKRAAVSADWELTSGATDEEQALAQLHEERAHVAVVIGDGFGGFVRRALDAYPALRVVADREIEGAVIVGGLEEVRDAVLGRPRSGPVI